MPQEKQNVAAQHKAQIQGYIKSRGIDPKKMIQYGQLAEAVLKDKSLYPMFRQRAIQDNIVDEKDLPKQMNPSIMGAFMAAGKVI
jgi:hypothetical protein